MLRLSLIGWLFDFVLGGCGLGGVLVILFLVDVLYIILNYDPQFRG